MRWVPHETDDIRWRTTVHTISASYRTDIPAFYGAWFLERVRAGSVQYQNPVGPQVVTLSLRPTDVHAIVFWSKNYAPFLRYLDDLDAHGLDCSFHYAITGYSADPATRPLETRVPHPNHTLDSFARLVEHYRQPLVVQ